MAIGKKTGGKDFKPGQTGNPNGRPKVPEDLKELRQLTRADLDRHLIKFMAMEPGELAEVRKNPQSTMLELLIISVMTHGVNKGDQQRLGWLVERISSIGKVKDQIDLEVSRPLRDLPNEELLARLPEAVKILKKVE